MKEFIDFIKPTKFKIFVAVSIFFLLFFSTFYCSIEGSRMLKFDIPDPSTTGIQPTPDPYAAYRIGAEMNSRFFPCSYLSPIVYQVLFKIQDRGILFSSLVYFLIAYFIAILASIKKGKTKS